MKTINLDGCLDRKFSGASGDCKNSGAGSDC
jgi:hypothetical protein